MEQRIRSAESYVFTTSTAEIKSPDDFIVEFFAEMPDLDDQVESIIKVKNIDELIDFLEKMDQ